MRFQRLAALVVINTAGLVIAGCSGNTSPNQNPHSAPQITAQPVNAVVCTDKVATFSVTATGTSPSYQWQVSTNGGVSFNSRINELQSRLTMQVGELKQWQNLANSEAEMRWQAEKKINELERIIQAAEKDNQRLKIEVQEWKLVAEECKTRAMKYDQAMRKILVCLEEVKP